MGYSHTQKGYKCYDPISIKFIVNMDVISLRINPTLSKTLFNGRVYDCGSFFWENIFTLVNL